MPRGLRKVINPWVFTTPKLSLRGEKLSPQGTTLQAKLPDGAPGLDPAPVGLLAIESAL